MDKKGVIYRVVLKISFYTAFFEFESGAEACEFATNALMHNVASEDTDKQLYVSVQIVNPEAESEDE